VNQYGITPLCWASVLGYGDIVELLLETGNVDVNFKDELNGQTPLYFAAGRGHEATP
jgi:ankyrin repeat domain-containing protein 50